jgi:hypothetical protein
MVLLGPAIAGVAIAVTAAGWWMSSAQAEAAVSIVDEIGEMDAVHTVSMPDGGALRVFYDPSGTHMLLHSCDLAHREPLEVDCRHRDGNPEHVVAEAVHSNSAAHDWWRVECRRPVGEYASFAVDVGSGEPAVLEMAAPISNER